MQRIVCFGPGPRFKGGLSNYNTSLAKALDAQPDTEVHIVSWTQQYPAIIPREFVDKASRKDLLEGTNIVVKYITNYNNPVTWRETYRHIVDLKPDKVVFQWSIAVQGLPLGRIIRWLNKHPEIEVIVDCHFVIQKENSKLDRYFTEIGIGAAPTYIVHARKTFEELREVFPRQKYALTETGERSRDADTATVIKLYHPIYDLFQPNPDFDVEAFKREHNLREHVFLFFGFIRKYKGLHHVIPAFAKAAAQRDDISLMICGESFWKTLDQKKVSTRVKNFLFGLAKKMFLKKQSDERDYRPLALIKEYGIEDRVAVFNEFIANEDVNKYFQASDCVMLYYEYATPSGIESLSYNFNKPLLATRVGHFPETITDGKNGYLAAPDDVEDQAQKILHFLDHPIPAENVADVAQHLSWENYAKAVLGR